MKCETATQRNAARSCHPFAVVRSLVHASIVCSSPSTTATLSTCAKRPCSAAGFESISPNAQRNAPPPVADEKGMPAEIEMKGESGDRKARRNLERWRSLGIEEKVRPNRLFVRSFVRRPLVSSSSLLFVIIIQQPAQGANPQVRPLLRVVGWPFGDWSAGSPLRGCSPFAAATSSPSAGLARRLAITLPLLVLGAWWLDQERTREQRD